jgi:hypothetical protein
VTTLDEVALLPCQPLLAHYCRTIFPLCDEGGIAIPCVGSCLDAVAMCRAEIGESGCKGVTAASILTTEAASPEDICQFFNLTNLYGPGITCTDGNNELI